MAGAIATSSAHMSVLSPLSRANGCNSSTAFRRHMHALQQNRTAILRRDVGSPLVVQAATDPAIVFQNNLYFSWTGRRDKTNSGWVNHEINKFEANNLKLIYSSIRSFSELSRALTEKYPAGKNETDGIITGQQYIQADFVTSATNMKPLNESGSLVVDQRGQPGLYDDLIDAGSYVMVPGRAVDTGDSDSAGPGVNRGAIVKLRIPFIIYGPAGSLSAKLESKA